MPPKRPEIRTLFIGTNEDPHNNLLDPLKDLLATQSSVTSYDYEYSDYLLDQIGHKIAKTRHDCFPEEYYSNMRFIFLNDTQSVENYTSRWNIGYNRELVIFIKGDKFTLAYADFKNDEVTYHNIQSSALSALQSIIEKLSPQKQLVDGYEQCCINNEEDIATLNRNILPNDVQLYKVAIFPYLLGQLITKMGEATPEVVTNFMIKILGEEFLRIYFHQKGVATIMLTQEGISKLAPLMVVFDIAQVFVTSRDPGESLYESYITEHSTHLRPIYKGDWIEGNLSSPPKKNELEIWHDRFTGCFGARYFDRNEDAEPTLKFIDSQRINFDFSQLPIDKYLKTDPKLFQDLTNTLELSRSCENHFLDPRLPSKYMSFESSKTMSSFQNKKQEKRLSKEQQPLEMLIPATTRKIEALKEEVSLAENLYKKSPKSRRDLYYSHWVRLNENLSQSINFLKLLTDRLEEISLPATDALQQNLTSPPAPVDVGRVDWTFNDRSVSNFTFFPFNQAPLDRTPHTLNHNAPSWTPTTASQ